MWHWFINENLSDVSLVLLGVYKMLIGHVDMYCKGCVNEEALKPTMNIGVTMT